MKNHSLAALCALAALALPASAKTYYVDGTAGDDASTGLSATAAFATIQKAIDKAAAGSTILVAPGTYAPIDSKGKKITIKSIEGPETTVIDGAGAPGVCGAELGAWGMKSLMDTGYREIGYYNRITGEITAIIATLPVRSYGLQHTFEVFVPKGWWGFIPAEESREGMLRGTIFKFQPPDEYFGEVGLERGCLPENWDYLWDVRRLERITYGKGLRYLGGHATMLSGFTITGCHQALRSGKASHCIVTGNTYVDGAADMQPYDNFMVCTPLSDSVVGGNSADYLFGRAPQLSRCEVVGNELRYYISGGMLANCLVARNRKTVAGSLFDDTTFYNTTIVDNELKGNDTADEQFIPAAEGEEGAWYDEWDDCWYKTVRGRWETQETTEDDEEGWYDDETGKYMKDVFVPIGDDEGWEPGPVMVRCDVFNSILWGNRSRGSVANVSLVTDEKTGRTMAEDYMNHISDGYEKKPSCSMMSSLVEDFLVEQKGNKPSRIVGTAGKSAYRNKNSTGNISADPLFIDPENGDYRLAPNSPCKDAGADYTKKTGKYDLDSGARKVGKVDMGAYELQPQTAVPADYDGDGITDAAFYFAASGQWWIFPSGDPGTVRTHSLPDRNGVPCPAAYDGGGAAEPAYFTAAAKTPEFVRIKADGTAERTEFGVKGATPVAARFSAGGPAMFGVYTANAKKPEFAFTNGTTVVFGAKASRPVVADFDKDGMDDIGVYTATAAKPAFSILQNKEGFSTAKLFNGGPVALGAKGAIPCCADFDGDGYADFGTYLSNAKEPYFSRLFSEAKFRETRTLPMGSKGDAPVVGVYETAYGPAAPAVWTGSKWSYLGSDWDEAVLLGE